MKKRKIILILFLIVISSICFVSAAFVDNSSLTQTLHDCGTLNTTNAVYTMNQSFNTSATTCFTLTANNITIEGNGYTISGNGSGYGININTLSNFNIYNFDTIQGFNSGIYLANADNGIIRNMTLLNNGRGINSPYFSNNNTLSNLVIRSNSNGIFVLESFNDNVLTNLTIENNSGTGLFFNYNCEGNNLINIISNSNGAAGVYLGESPYNTLTNVTANRNNDYGIYIQDTYGNQIINSTTSSNYDLGLYLGSPGYLLVNFESYNNTNSEIYADDWGYSTGNILRYNNQFGEITLAELSSNVEGDLRFGLGKTFQIANNSAYVNGSISGLNKSANVTLRNLPTNFARPVILKDGQVCTDCYNFTSLNAGNVVFNVSSWSNYSIGEEEIPLFCGGNGTSGNPYQICTWTHLNNTRLNLTAHYILNNSLNGSMDDYAGLGDNWQPIGNEIEGYRFAGSFDGKGHTISNLTINLPSTNYVGLFGYIAGDIHNTNLVGVNISGSESVGGLSGKQGGGTISNCSSKGDIVGFSYYVGGLVGSQSGGTISNCSFSGNVVGFGIAWVGGLVGRQNLGTISDSYSVGNVSGLSEIGGLVGYCSGIISGSYSIANVISSSQRVGGLIGKIRYGTVSNSHSIVSEIISGTNYIGALVGEVGTDSVLDSSYSIVETSAILNGSSNVGIIGREFDGGVVTNSYMTIRNATFGNITFLQLVTGGNGNLLDSIEIGNNSAYVNGSISGLNKSANVTLRNLPTNFARPVILKDGIYCPAPSCNILSYVGNVITFNVTSWSNYTIGEEPVAAVTPAPTGGGGGGSSTATNKEWTLTKVISDEQIKTGTNILLGSGQKAEFNLLGYTKSYFGIKNINGSIIIFQTSIDLKNITAEAGKILKFDYTKEGYYDLEVDINSIANEKANLTFKEINEKIIINAPKEEILEVENKTSTESLPNKENKMQGLLNLIQDWRIISAVVSLLAIIISATLILRHKRKSAVIKKEIKPVKKQKHK